MKKCSFCWEKIQDIAKKCKHCWERLEEPALEEIDDNKRKKSTNPIIRFFKYALFFILSCVLISLAQSWFLLLLAMFSYIGLWRILFLWWICFGLLNFWVWYITIFLFKIVPNKKTWIIIFVIVLILMTIPTLINTWRFVNDLDIPRTIKVIYSIAIIWLCIVLSSNLEDLSEGSLY